MRPLQYVARDRLNALRDVVKLHLQSRVRLLSCFTKGVCNKGGFKRQGLMDTRELQTPLVQTPLEKPGSLSRTARNGRTCGAPSFQKPLIEEHTLHHDQHPIYEPWFLSSGNHHKYTYIPSPRPHDYTQQTLKKDTLAGKYIYIHTHTSHIYVCIYIHMCMCIFIYVSFRFGRLGQSFGAIYLEAR